MSASKKSSQKSIKKNSNKNSKRLFYAFILLFVSNIVVFAFLGYFVFKIIDNKVEVYGQEQIRVMGIPRLDPLTEIEISAVSYIVYDPISRTILLSKNDDIRLSPASSIKILSALVALDHYDLYQYLAGVPATYDESRMGLYVGEEINVENLLYGLLLISGNDAAKTLAFNYDGGLDSFVYAMNLKAKELGLTESYFVDPSGYMDSNYSTAFDLARLGAYSMQNEKIREIVKTKNKIVYDKNFLSVHVLNNLNELLVDEKVTGVKTGFTNEAGGVLISSYVHDNRELIIVVMKSDDRFSDTRKIIEHIENNISYSDVLSTD